MPNTKAYPTMLVMPSRKQRKAQRRSIFAYNAAQAAVERKARRDARKKEKRDGE